MKILCLLAVLYTSIVLSTSTPAQQFINTNNNGGNTATFLDAAAEGASPDVSAQLTLDTSSSTPTQQGSVYTRWGKSDCPDTAELVYSGITAGHHYGHIGAGANYLCLPKDPEYPESTRAGAQAYGLIYGTEYRQPLLGAQNYNPPCAVCSVSRSSSLMIPAKQTCPSADWTEEYIGYLMSESISYSASMYVCVDKSMEVIPGSEALTGGAWIFHVEADCTTGLPCPPYDRNKELSCVVCTR